MLTYAQAWQVAILVSALLAQRASPIFRTLCAGAVGAQSAGWLWGQYTGEDLCRRGKAEAVEDLFVAVAQSGGVDHAADGGPFNVQAVGLEHAQQPFRGQSFLGLSFLRRDVSAIEPFQHLVGLQGDLQQADQCFDAAT